MRKELHEASLGETINGFYLYEKLHQSLVGKLYRVTHPDHPQPMVMKVPRLDVILPPSAYASFETEVRILSRLRGRVTPRVIAKGDLASCPYIVLEYIEEKALHQAVLRAPVSVERLVSLMAPLCKAVHALHQHNIIHLDIKPGNIRNRHNGSPVILDFGSAHHTYMPDMYEDAHEVAPRSLDYVAPEQLYNIRHDSRSDIYALGVILYQLATGELPFANSNQLTVRKRLYLAPVPPRALDFSLPPWLQEIILKCLQRRPDDRFASAKQVAYALSHPNMVTLTAQAELTRKSGWLQIVRFWLQAGRDNFQRGKSVHPYERVTSALHVLVALDLNHVSKELNQALCNTVSRLARSESHCFFTLITIIEQNELSPALGIEEIIKKEQPANIVRQVELRQWVKTLKLESSRVNFQVIEGNVAHEIISYAKHHVVDHIVIGSRGSSVLRRYMGSISSKVVAEAPCSVTVVRSQDHHQD